jgi:probable selenium-dependent hydroxylase accessory protein YqeC
MTNLKDALILKQGGVVSLVGAGGKTSLMYRLAHELMADGSMVLTTTTTKIFVPTAEQSSRLILSASPDRILDEAQKNMGFQRHITAAFGKTDVEDKLAGFSPEIIDRLWEAGVFQWILVEADGARNKPLKAPAAHEPVIPQTTDCVVGVVGLDSVHKPLEENWVFRHQLYAKISGLKIGKPITEASISDSIQHANGIMKGSPSHATQIVFLNKAELPGGLDMGRSISKHFKASKQNSLDRVVIGSICSEPPVLEYTDLN